MNGNSLIVDVLKSVKFVIPNIPDIDWNDNGVELITLKETDGKNLKGQSHSLKF